MAEEFDRAALHEDFTDLWNFVHELCEKESKLILTHAQDEEPPACEMVTRPPRFAVWEDPGLMPAIPFGLPCTGIRGDMTDQANTCPFCGCFVWVNPSTPVGTEIGCWKCHGQFRRTL